MAMSESRRAQVREACDAAVSADREYTAACDAVEAARKRQEELRQQSLATAAQLRALLAGACVIYRGNVVNVLASNDFIVVRPLESVEVLDPGLPVPVDEPSVADEIVAGMTELSEALGNGDLGDMKVTTVAKPKKGKAKPAEGV